MSKDIFIKVLGQERSVSGIAGRCDEKNEFIKTVRGDIMIGRNTKNFTGFILQDNEKIYFHVQDRIFNFISEEVGLVAAFKKKTIISQEYFLHGYTSDG